MMKRLLIPALFLFLAVSCQEPFSVERFIAAPGPYEFQVDMTDTVGAYDLAFYTRLDGTPESLQAAGQLPLRITWTSPSDSVYQEQVYLPLEGRTSLFSRQVYQPYRSGVRPFEAGLWTLSVSLPYADGKEMLQGLGLVVTERFD